MKKINLSTTIALCELIETPYEDDCWFNEDGEFWQIDEIDGVVYTYCDFALDR